MIASTPEELATAYSGSVDTYFALNRKLFDSVEKLVELNLSVTRAALQESAVRAKELLAIKDPQDLLAFNAAHIQPGTEKLMAYARHVYDIASQTQAELSRVAETQVSEGNQRLVSLFDSATMNAPTGSETAVAMLKSAIAAAGSAYDSMNKAARQAVELAEANVSAATKATIKTAAQAANAPRARKTA